MTTTEVTATKERIDDHLTVDEDTFVEAVKQITVYANVATIAFRDGNKKWALGKLDQVRAIIRTIEIFTGRLLAIRFINLECTEYELIENQYSDNEKVLYRYAAPVGIA
jgi:hypothetical protein